MHASANGLVTALVLGATTLTGFAAQAQQFDRPALWTGAYAGINAGGGSSTFKSGAMSEQYTASGALGGVHAGYNGQKGAFVGGIEADYDLAGIGRSTTDSAGDKIRFATNGLGSVRARAGVVVDRALIFATLGYGWAAASIRITDPAGVMSRFSNTNGGVVFGGGMEYKFSQHLSLRGEVLRYNATGDWTDTSGAKVKIDTPTTTVRAGISYHF